MAGELQETNCTIKLQMLRQSKTNLRITQDRIQLELYLKTQFVPRSKHTPSRL